MAPSATAEEIPFKVNDSSKVKQLPVTLLSGFLGSGKTTLLEHVLKSNEHGLRIAVIVNDMASLNIDATLISQHTVSQSKEKLIQLQNGCICCTLRGDLLEELVRLARTDGVQYVVIESTGISEPMQVAETFTSEFSKVMIEQMQSEEFIREGNGLEILREINDLGGLHKLARLDTTVSVIDAFNLFNNFSTAEFLSDRYGPDQIIPEDERTITDLMVDQLEFADVIIVNKIDAVDDATKRRVLGLVRRLNPVAKVIESRYCRIDVKEILDTGLFSFEKAVTGSGWLRSLHDLTAREIGGVVKMAPKPETEEYGISSFVYQARKPFHPKRLFDLIHDKFIVLQNTDQVEEEEEERECGQDLAMDDGDQDQDEDKESEDEDIEMSDSLAEKRFENIDPQIHWIITKYREEAWPEEADIVQAIEADFKGPWGDRRQEIVFIGERVDKKLFYELLEQCLLTDSEMKRWERVMWNEKYSEEQIEDKLNVMFEDGFEDWSLMVPEGGQEHLHEGHNH